MSVLFAILLFSLLILLHELGHFMAAKAFGVQVNEFSMFMGPAVWKKQMGETLYALRCIPIGGYCAMEGEDGETDNPRSFAAAAWWKRLIILIAGAAMNFLAGVALMAAFFAPDKQFILPVIDLVEPECVFAGEQGVMPGDRILSVDGEKVYVYNDVTFILSMNEGDIHDLVLERNGQRVVLDNLNMQKHAFENEDGSTSMRYGFSFTVIDAAFSQKWEYTWNTAWDTIRMVRLSLQMLLSGKAGLKDVSGPVGIVEQMAEVADSSGSLYYAFLNMLYFGGFIAINLAVMNLLPIPALDGGRVAGLLLTTLIEAVLRRKIDPKYEGYIHSAGMLLLLALMALIFFKDIITIFRR